MTIDLNTHFIKEKELIYPSLINASRFQDPTSQRSTHDIGCGCWVGFLLQLYIKSCSRFVFLLFCQLMPHPRSTLF